MQRTTSGKMLSQKAAMKKTSDAVLRPREYCCTESLQCFFADEELYSQKRKTSATETCSMLKRTKYQAPTADKCINTYRSYLRTTRRLTIVITKDAFTQTQKSEIRKETVGLGKALDEHEEEENNKKRSPIEHKYGIIAPPVRQIQMLLVFQQPDSVMDTIAKAGDKLGFEAFHCGNHDLAVEEFNNKHFDLIVVDARQQRLSEYESLCKSIRNTRGGQYCVLVALVKKSVLERDDGVLMNLLDAGFNKCLVETSSYPACLNEMLQLRHSELRSVSQQSVCQTLYSALDKIKDLIVITDDNYKIQYTNRAFNKTFGYRPDDLLGKNLHDHLATDLCQVNSMSANLHTRREWQGQLLLKRKTTDEKITSNCRALPVTCIGRATTHYVLLLDVTTLSDQVILSQSRGSLHSLRRGSTDVRSIGSDYLRRTSLAKLSTLPLEAPISKILALINQAQEWSQQNPSVIQILDKVIDQLHSTELYTIHINKSQSIKAEEAVASDLISGLLVQQPTPVTTTLSRRSSNDSGLTRRLPQGPKIKVPPQLKEILDTCLSWEFDIFRLEKLCQRRPLQHLGMTLFLHFDVPNTLNCDESTLFNWLTIVEHNYHLDNTYHNSTHAADVMQASAGFLEKERMKSIMEPLDEATSLIAAAAHDIDHPGKSSAFLANCNHILAILYNDVTILEMHHASLTFKLTLGDERVNIFKNLDTEMYKIARHNVIDMILATEMTKHFEHLAKFVNVFCEKPGDLENEGSDYLPISLPENVTLVKRMMIKCADVSNPTRPLRQCVEWAARIAEEYFRQTDEEKAKGLPVVMPMFDRATCSVPKAQIGFVDFIINDMFEAWNAFIDMPELIAHMRQNYLKWKELDEQGHTTLPDIRKIQNSMLLSPVFLSNTDQKT